MILCRMDTFSHGERMGIRKPFIKQSFVKIIHEISRGALTEGLINPLTGKLILVFFNFLNGFA